MKWQVSIDFFKSLLNTGALIIDIQEENEFAFLNVSQAINVPYEKLMLYPEKYLVKSKDCYLICPEGTISLRAAQILEKLGYSAYSIAGGYGAYFNIEGISELMNLDPSILEEETDNPKLLEIKKRVTCIPCLKRMLQLKKISQNK